ncbi:MAG: hypothetical protein NC300_05750, partial [Bacteroidales bacterium]|nr:hypothetical protein [Clostridium sp.]MCM1203626.1 hypothetical protein [Bacteroidales bacterium]
KTLERVYKHYYYIIRVGEKMSPRTGRPKVDAPKAIEAKARLTEDENQKLLAYCKQNGMTRSDAIRKALYLLWDK